MSGLAPPHVLRRRYCSGLSRMVFLRCRFCSFGMQVHVRNLNRSTDVLRCSSVSCVETVSRRLVACVRSPSPFDVRMGFYVFSHCRPQLVLSKFPTDRFFARPIMKATFVLAASVCGGRSSSESHQRTVEPRSAGVHGHWVAQKPPLFSRVAVVCCFV